MGTHLKTLGKYSVQEVIDLYTTWAEGFTKGPAKYTIDNIEYSVNRGSQRYAVFANSTVCVACGLVGSYMLLQCSPNNQPNKAHFNLYGDLFGETIMLTKDHIVPRSKGGPDRLDNYQTMCLKCNMCKADNPNLISPKDIIGARLMAELGRLNLKDKNKNDLLKQQISWLEKQTKRITV